MVTDAVLDTSVLIDLLRAFPPATDWFAGLGRQRHGIPLVDYPVEDLRSELNALRNQA